MDYDVIGKVAAEDGWEVVKKFFEENKDKTFMAHHTVVHASGLKLRKTSSQDADADIVLEGGEGGRSGARIMKETVANATPQRDRLLVHFKTSGLVSFEIM